MHRGIPLLALALLFGDLGGQEPGSPGPDNPFADFETHVLDNGLRLWYRHLPGAANTTAAVAVPFGWDQDPRGKEELAHFLEHMLFSDHRGLTEEEIKDQVESLGGRRNGITSPDRTFYYVTLPSRHGLFGVEWLSRILEPHEMAPAVVERNRQPVALEVRARPRELFDHLGAWLNPEWLQRDPFWEREFGLDTRASREWDRHESLHSITPEDLDWFYHRYYAPGAMTLVVVGDVPGDSVLALAERTFGTLEERPVPRGYQPSEDPGRAYKSVSWTFRPDIRYRRLFKVYDLDARTHARLVFLAEYLQRRLSARLRFGETKAVYSVRTSVVQRGPAAYLLVEAPVDEERWTYARDAIQEELDALAGGTTPVEDFRRDRDAVVERMAAQNRESQELAFWVRRAFYRPSLHADFPDLVSIFRSLDQAEISEFVQAHFVPGRQVTYIYRPQPLTQGMLLVLVGLVGILALKGTARVLTVPVDMTRIRYLARLKPPAPILLVGAILILGAGVVAGRLLAAVLERAMYAWVIPVDSYLYQMGAYLALGALGLALVVAYLSLPPRKILVFPDHVRIKYLAYRSRVIPMEELRHVGWARLGDVAGRGRLHRTVPLAAGIVGPVLYLEPREGWGYLFRVREPTELLRVLTELGAPVSDGGADEA